MKTLSYFIFILLLIAFAIAAEARTWTAKTGQTIDGEFAKLEDGTVSIQLPDGKQAKIKLDLLSDTDQQFVQNEVKKTGGDSPFIIEDSPFQIEDVPPTSEHIRKAAEQGDAEAQYRLGVCYHWGSGVPQDKGEAAKWYRKSADQGFASAQHNLGFLYAGGDGVPRDKEEAVKWFRKAAEQEDALAQFRLGTCYLYGNGVPENNTEAVAWFRKAAEQGLAMAQCQLGECLLKGIGVLQDQVEAVKWLHKSAEQEYAAAQFNLSACYLFGAGVPQDMTEGIKWLRKAAEQDVADAQALLGSYFFGEGDKEEGIKWLRKAADQGHQEAREALRKIEDGFIAVSSSTELSIELQGHRNDVSSAVFSPDGKKIVTTSYDETVRIWDALSGRELHKLSPGFPVRNVRFAADSKRFMTDQDDLEGNAIQIWDAESGKELQRKEFGTVIFVSANLKKIVAVAGDDENEMQVDSVNENVPIWDVESGRVRTLRPKGLAQYGLFFSWCPGATTAVSPDGTKIVTVRGDDNNSYIQVWDADSGRTLRSLGGVQAGNQSSRPILGRLRGQQVTAHEFARTALFSPDGLKIATHSDETVQIWDTQSGRALQKFAGYAGDFSPDGSKFAIVSPEGSEDFGTVRIWDVNTGRKIAMIQGSMNVLFSPDGKKIVTAGEDAPIRVWDANSGRQLFELPTFPDCFSSDSKTIVVADGNSGTQILDAESGKEKLRLKGSFAAFSHDGKKIALLNGNTVQVHTFP